ncbi:M16 family metallopeptidase [Erythrobacter dokdonensis]|uniref:Putative Zn-dependent peptidase n=1 Tax=Erythrobacter dokdonensis DSW-74 TaxID=1300349 RepID=A0A1A7BE64_9SPHN|nr:pitrilysin family protein [Erythrobacter dokdonensis]OBV10051.1 putative Zn-dependent peptidase [Erythrobacter dokdonensis DSW-74]
MTHRIAAASLTALALALAAPTTPVLADNHSAASAGQQATADLSSLVAQVKIPYEEFQLDNGLTVIVHEDRKAPVVGVAVWYNVGSKDEPEGKTGFAHLFEHLMFNGSENAPQDYFQYLAEMGATDYNGTTNFDRTNYFQTVPRPALERALWLESDRMGYLLGAVTQEKLDNQRGVVQNEKRQGDNQPGGLVFYEILKTLFPEGHPYHHSVIGSMADLDAASMEDVRKWFTDKYGPNNATLVMAGDVSAAEARVLAEKYFGGIKRGPVNSPAAAEVPTLKENVRKVMRDQVAATTITRYWPAPGITDAELTALNVGAAILGGLASSRLDEVLVRDEQLAVSVSANSSNFQRVGLLSVSATAKPGVDIAVLEERLNALVTKFIAEGPTEDEVRRAATSGLARTIRGLEQVGGFGGKAVTLANGEVLAGDASFYATQLDRLAKVTPADVRQAMARWMNRPAFTLVLEPGERDANYEEAASVGAASANASERDRSAETLTVTLERPKPPISTIAELDFPDIERATLVNGMKVTYAGRTAVPATYVAMSFNAGSAADPSGKAGLESLTMDLFTEGTASLTGQQIAEASERLGVSINANGDDDRSTFTMSALSANLAPSLELMRQIMREPAFKPEDLERVRTQAVTRIRQTMKSPQGIAQRTLTAELFGPQSPYGEVSTVASVSAITRDDLVAFKDTWIRPDNGEVFVISDRPLSEIVEALNGAFGDWRAPQTAKGSKRFDTAAAAKGQRIILVNRPNSPQSIIFGAQITPLDAGEPEFVAFNSANNSLGGNFLARLNMNLRETKGWSYGVRGGTQARENAVIYGISGGVQADRTGDSLAEMIRETTEFLTTKGVTPEELERTIASEVGALPGRFETSPAVLNAMQSNALFGRPDDYQEKLAGMYRTQTRESLDAVARAALDVDDFVWVVVGDGEKVRPQLEGLGLPIEQREMEAGE